MKQMVLITGASGAVGYPVLRELLRRYDLFQTRILSLDTSHERRFFKCLPRQVEIVWGDIRNLSVVRKAVEGVKSVLHIAGIIPPTADHNPQLAWDVNVNGTRNIVETIRNQPHPPKLIFTSSISVYGDRVNNPNIQVGDPLHPSDGDVYARTKIEAERIIQESGVHWSIFRLCGILVRNLKIQPLMFHIPLDTALEWCHDVDVGYALVRAIGHNEILGKIHNLGGGVKCRIKARDFLQRMLPMWGLDASIIPDYAFATRNFHSGYYLDGSKLADLLQFQRYTLNDYFTIVKSRVSPVTRFFIKSIPRYVVRKWLLNMSEPLRAVKENNNFLIKRYYGSRQAFKSILADEAAILG